jgi:hypothetical protein
LEFDELLRFIMSKKRPEDRGRIFKMWVRQGLREHRHFMRFINAPLTATPEPSDEDVSAELDKWKADRLDESRAKSLAKEFEKVLERYTASNYEERAKKAAAKRWHKDENSS